MKKLILSVLVLCLTVSVGAQQDGDDKKAEEAKPYLELRLVTPRVENRHVLKLDQAGPHLHLVMTNVSEDRLRLQNPPNTTGYDAMGFIVEDVESGKRWEMKRSPASTPTSLEDLFVLEPGEMHVMSVFFTENHWQGVPFQEDENTPRKIRIQATYDVYVNSTATARRRLQDKNLGNIEIVTEIMEVELIGTRKQQVEATKAPETMIEEKTSEMDPVGLAHMKKQYPDGHHIIQRTKNNAVEWRTKQIVDDKLVETIRTYPGPERFIVDFHAAGLPKTAKVELRIRSGLDERDNAMFNLSETLHGLGYKGLQVMSVMH